MGMSGWRRWTRLYLTLSLIAGLAIRLLLFHAGLFRGDEETFAQWATRLVTVPLSSFYGSAGEVDHLPGDLWILWGLARLYRHVSPAMDVQRFAFQFLLKLVPALADVGIGLTLYLMGRRLAGPWAGLLAAWFYLFNPASIFLTSIWGQWDSVSVCAMLIALWLLMRGSPEWALPVLTYACLVKPQLALLIPLVVVAWWRWSIQPPGRPRRIRENLRREAGRAALAVAGSLGVFLLICLPFSVGLPLLPTRWTIFDRLTVALDHFRAVSENAFNLWGIVTQAGSLGVADSRTFLLGLSYQTWGYLLLGVTMGLVLGLCWWRPSREMLVWGALAITFAAFMFPTRVHERYLLPAVALALLVAALAPALRWLGAALSLTYLANLYEVYHLLGGAGFFGGSQFGGQFDNRLILVISAANLFLFLVVIVAGFALVRMKEFPEGLPAGSTGFDGVAMPLTLDESGDGPEVGATRRPGPVAPAR